MSDRDDCRDDDLASIEAALDSLSRCARCRIPSPDDDAALDRWQIIGSALVCPGCLTPIEHQPTS
jgi:hypothetical protein